MSSSANNLKNSPNSAHNSGPLHVFPTTLIGTAMKALKYQHIAPAPPGHSSSSSSSGGGGDSKTRKYMARAASLPYNVDQTQSVQRRNARERNRVKQVNNSFVRLRQHIPQSIITDLTKGGGRGPHKKISKVDTLRIAVEYIRRLQDLVDDLNGGSETDSFSGAGGSSSHAASDTASNSSFSSSNSGSSSNGSALETQAQLYYTTSAATETVPISATERDQPAKQQQLPSGLLTPVSLSAYSPAQTQLEAGGQSPTSSFNSSLSSYEAAASFEHAAAALTHLSPPHHFASSGVEHGGSSGLLINSQTHLNAHLQLKFEPYESFALRDNDCTPDDEEILDYISLWQEE